MVTAWALEGIPEIVAGDDLAMVIGDLLALPLRAGRRTSGGFAPGSGPGASTLAALFDGDIVVVTSKIVSKAEGRFLAADDRKRRSPPKLCGWLPLASMTAE